MAHQGHHDQEFLGLQKKLFIRWVNQKLQPRGIVIDDLDGLSDGLVLISLMELLSETKFSGKIVGKPKMRPQKINNAALALDFVFHLGVQMKLKPSPENLVDAEKEPILVLGLLWGIMQKYLRFTEDDDDEEHPADAPVEKTEYRVRDSLLNWVQNQVSDYNLPVTDMTKCFHNGLVLCAIVHKYLPQLIPFKDLDPQNWEYNLQQAFNGAEVLFGLEQYLKPSDILKLDEKCMIVYVSEFYYGSTGVRKVVASVRRISKLIKYTQTNDQLRDNYKKESHKLAEHVNELKTRMGDRSRDNTFNGAKGKLEDFYVYKKEVKGHTVDAQYLALETVYNKLSMRLMQNSRPPYQSDPGMSLPELLALLKELDLAEAQRKIALHDELNRQIKLRKLNDQHKARFDGFSAWAVEKQKYLNVKENIGTVGEALYQLSTLFAFNKELKTLNETTTAELKNLSSVLKAESFEGFAEVQARENNLAKLVEDLRQLASKKQSVLEDDLAREKYKEKIQIANQKHITEAGKTRAWQEEKRKYLTTKETVTSIREAQLALLLLEAYRIDKKDTLEGKIVAFKKIGDDIRTSKYQTKLSSWTFPNKEEVDKREKEVLDVFPQLDDLYNTKLKTLKDDLARELFKEDLRQKNKQHIARFKEILEWVQEKKAYLTKKDAVDSIRDAKTNLATLELYVREKTEKTSSSVAALKSLGDQLLNDKYETQLSSYQWESPAEVKDREKQVDEAWATLEELHRKKLAVAEDDLHRELFREKLRQENELHKTKYANLNVWIKQKTEYLQHKEPVESITQAQENLNTLAAYVEKKKEVTSGDVAAFKKLGKLIIDAVFKTELSQYRFATPEEIRTRENYIDNAWIQLDELHASKLAILQDDLDRERFRENTRQENEKHKNQYNLVVAWTNTSKVYLEKKEPVNSIAEAEKNLSDLGSYDTAKVDVLNGAVVALKKRGGSIRAAKYQTKFSSWTFPTPEELTAREKEVDSIFSALEKLQVAKKAVLLDDLARERFKEKLRQENEQHKAKYAQLKTWVAAKVEYLQKKEKVASIAQAEENLNTLGAYTAEKVVTTNGQAAAFTKLGAQIIADKYETSLSNWVWPTPEEIRERERNILSEDWGRLDSLYAAKRDILADDLERELFKEKLRQINQQHLSKSETLNEWIADRRSFLEKAFTVSSISEAEKNLNDLLAYIEDKVIQTSGRLAAFKRQGADLRAAKYESKFSTWAWEDAEGSRERERKVDMGWDQLDALGGIKRGILEDQLAREKFKERTRQQNELHKSQFAKLQDWVAEKKAYNEKKEAVQSIRDAQFNLNTHASYEEEKEIVTQGTVAAWKKLGADIIADKYETKLSFWNFPTPDEIKQRESAIDKAWVELDNIAKQKRAILEDDLARELFRENLRQQNEQHKKIFDEINQWVGQKKTYLTKKEPVDSVTQAQQNLAVLVMYHEENNDRTTGTVDSFKRLGESITKAKYTTQLSTFVYATPAEIAQREQQIDSEWAALHKLSNEKQAILNDDLAREVFRENLRQDNEQHRKKFEEIQVWIAEKKAYLQKKEAVASISEAQINLTNLAAYDEEKSITVSGSIAWLKNLGAHITSAKYESKHSTFVFKTPREVSEREKDVNAGIVMLDDLYTVKQEILEDDLTRETFRDKLRQENEDHTAKHKSLREWVAEKKQYLETKEPVDSISKAQENLGTLAAYSAEKVDVTNGAVAGLKLMGAAIASARYQSKYSSYVFPDPLDVKGREKDIDDAWQMLEDLRKKKLAVLEDDLARELFKEKLRQWNVEHKERLVGLERWSAQSSEYLRAHQPATSIANATYTLNKLESWKADKEDMTQQGFANFKNLGAEIKKARYKTGLSEYSYDNPDEIDVREAQADKLWETLDDEASKRNEILEDDLAREERKEELRLVFADVAGDFARWCKDQAEEAASTHFGFTLDQVEAFKATLKEKDKTILENGAAKQETAKNLHVELTVVYGDQTENVYTKETPKTLDERFETLKKALEARQAAYKEELSRQKRLDDLCKQFAKLVDPFVKSLDETKAKITDSRRDLIGQLSYINEMTATASKKFETQIIAINDLQAKLDMEGVTTNRHTVFTALDATVQLTQFSRFLDTKKQNLEEEIRAQQMRGVTKEELDEMEHTFKRFAKEGVLGHVELKACLYAMGEERGNKEIRKIMRESGTDDGMDVDAFQEFMIKQYGDSDTKEEIIDSFALINGEIAPSVELRGIEEAKALGVPERPVSCTYIIKKTQMDLWMPAHDREYIGRTATPVETDSSKLFSEAGGYYYQGWVDDMFAR